MPMSVVYTNFDGQIVHENRGGVERTYVSDPQGSTIALLDEEGTVTDTFDYWPYGEVSERTGSSPTPFGFVGTLGYYEDPDGSVYVRARDYRPELARWQTVDPLWPDESAYGYVSGRPVDWVDPSGMQSCNSLQDNGKTRSYLGLPFGNATRPVESGNCVIIGGTEGVPGSVTVALGPISIDIPLESCPSSACSCTFKKYSKAWWKTTEVCNCVKTDPFNVRCGWKKASESKCFGLATQIILDCFTARPSITMAFFSETPGCSGLPGRPSAFNWRIHL